MHRLRAVSPLQIQVSESHEAMSQLAADLVVTALRVRPDLLLCASAGGTPARAYELLGARYARQPRLFRHLRVLQIDEWGGLPRKSPASCERDLRRRLVDPLHLRPEQFIGFRTDAADPRAECQRVERWLARNGPIDLCILGLGINGHVGMNEPASALVPHVHVAKLASSSRQHPMLRDLRRKPRYGLTLGMADILRSRQILLLVSGAHKRAVLQRLMEPRVTPRGRLKPGLRAQGRLKPGLRAQNESQRLGEPIVTPRFPASLLWLHPNALVLCDHEACPQPNS